jgi:hypothetical protein
MYSSSFLVYQFSLFSWFVSNQKIFDTIYMQTLYVKHSRIFPVSTIMLFYLILRSRKVWCLSPCSFWCDQIRVITVFTVFRLLTDFVCLYIYEFWLSLCKIVLDGLVCFGLAVLGQTNKFLFMASSWFGM